MKWFVQIGATFCPSQPEGECLFGHEGRHGRFLTVDIGLDQLQLGKPPLLGSKAGFDRVLTAQNLEDCAGLSLPKRRQSSSTTTGRLLGTTAVPPAGG
jgi:hypothetical protein